jgi:hypothetical protein
LGTSKWVNAQPQWSCIERIAPPHFVRTWNAQDVGQSGAGLLAHCRNGLGHEATDHGPSPRASSRPAASSSASPPRTSSSHHLFVSMFSNFVSEILKFFWSFGEI